MYSFFLALRYLRAHRVMYFAVAGVAVGISVILVVTSLMGGFTRDLRGLVRGLQSHLQVEAYGLRSNFLTDYERRADAIRGLPHVASAAPRLEYAAWMGVKGARRPVRIIGIDPARETDTEFLAAFRRGGASLDSLSGDWAVVGWDIPLEKGDYAALVTAREPGAYDRAKKLESYEPFVCVTQGDGFLVAGKFRSGVWDYDSSTVFLPLPQMQKLLRLDAPPAASLIAVGVDDYDANGLAVATQLRSDRAVQVLTWEQVHRTLLTAVQNEQSIQVIILFMIVVVASFTIFSIYMMMVRAKQRDVGVLRALGATGAGVTAAFTLSGAICGLIGSILGIALGLFLSFSLDPFVTYVRAVSRGLAAQPRWEAWAALGCFVGAYVMLIAGWQLLYSRPKPLRVLWTAALTLAGWCFYNQWTHGYVPNPAAREPSSMALFPTGVFAWIFLGAVLSIFYRRPAIATIGNAMLAAGLLLVGGIAASVALINPSPGFAGFDLFPRQVYHLDRVPVRVDGAWIAAVVVATFVIGAVASIWPAVRASRYDPLEAIRDE